MAANPNSMIVLGRRRADAEWIRIRHHSSTLHSTNCCELGSGSPTQSGLTQTGQHRRIHRRRRLGDGLRGARLGAGQTAEFPNVGHAAHPDRHQIDPATGAVRQTLRVPPGSYNPLYSDGQVWVTRATGSEITAVDAVTGVVSATAKTGPGPRFLTAGAGAVWTRRGFTGNCRRRELVDGLSWRRVAQPDAVSDLPRLPLTMAIKGSNGYMNCCEIINRLRSSWPTTAASPGRNVPNMRSIRIIALA